VCLLALVAAAMPGCGSVPPAASPPPLTTLPLTFEPKDKASWEPVQLPGKLLSAFRLAHKDDRSALHTVSSGSIGMLRRKLSIAPEQLGLLNFEWQVNTLIDGADMTRRETEDSPVRLVLAFDGDRSRFSAANQMLNELTRAITGEDMPYAVLMYVWSNDLPVGTLITNPRTDRIRKIVVESGAGRLQQWLRYERDVRSDFLAAFGETPEQLQSIAIMTDTDNTRGHTQAWYGRIHLSKPQP
jgi:Protein of unknown function (DUF3047)